MTLENPSEIWQVEVGGQIYEASLAELPEWISEGSLQPEDKVRKGNLRWIEARKVPTLIPFFNARANGEPIPVVQTTTDASLKPDEQAPHEDVQGNTGKITPTAAQTEASLTSPQNVTVAKAAIKTAPGHCVNHHEQRAVYVCSQCGSEFCKLCPRSYGGVRICPECGAFCNSADKVAESARRAAVDNGLGSEPFGFADFSRALAYPFRFRASLIFGGLMFMLFSFGQMASSIGGIILIGASIICFMLANMLWFGVLTNTVENFTQGRLDADFMPSFEDFSLLDDVVHPFFLYIGVVLSSFGPFILVAVIGVYLVISAATDQMNKFNDELSRVPGTQFYRPDRTVEQSQEVKNVLEKVKQQNDRRLSDQQHLAESAESGVATDIPAYSQGNAEEELVKAAEELQQARAKELQSIAGSPDANPKDQFQDAMANILRLAAPLVVIGAIAFLWGLFYFPAACAVAGYSRSFMATVNPLVGLDTIKRLGGTYVKILLMGLLILIASGIIGLMLQMMLFPLNLPRLGNVPAKAIGSLFTFYFSVVFSCIIGYALFKSADRLKLHR